MNACGVTAGSHSDPGVRMGLTLRSQGDEGGAQAGNEKMSGVDAINFVMLIAPLVTVVAIGGVRVGSRLGLPALLLFLLFGMVLGESGFGFEFDDATIAQGLGYAALVLILAPQVASNYEDIKQDTDRLGVKLAKTQGGQYIKLTRDGQGALAFVQEQFED